MDSSQQSDTVRQPVATIPRPIQSPPSRCSPLPIYNQDSSQASSTVSQQVARLAPPTSSPPSRCIPDNNLDSSQASDLVSQHVPTTSRCIPDPSLTSSNSSQASVKVSQQVARLAPPTSSSPPSRCIPDNSLDSSQASDLVSQHVSTTSRCIPDPSLDTSPDSSQGSGTVSQDVPRPSRCIPDPSQDTSPDSSQASGTVSQDVPLSSRCIPNPSQDSSPVTNTVTPNPQKPTHLPPHTSPLESDNLQETSTISTQCSSDSMKKNSNLQKVQRRWQELTRDEDNVVKMMKVVDYGVRLSARKGRKLRLMTEEENKATQNSEVVKMKRKLVRQSIPINLTPQKPHFEKKKTSLNKVKIASTKKKKLSDKNIPKSPGLKRLQTARLDKIEPSASSLSPKPGKSQKSFNKLLLSWENISTRNNLNLTSAVRKPRSDEAAEIQSEQALQTSRKNETGV